ncbi:MULTISPECIES: hypothetical protein [Streptomyces]|nr:MULTISPECIES: hypothetical protein [Streptomyces]MBA5220136.1 hypothetical protein [Streptomyces griseoaurantiacus]MCF0087858.1 hypothetical protein [Streptomyces sp. MH192]MCF0097632.1 hypothetical protein [Streptomyces sp. MH191]MDX3090534.1 hypothetical protein [Streptomyces sp. ME12-02E]MDX3333906.1 hypothetical protein [Streptomyces sp. ME02-6978a]
MTVGESRTGMRRAVVLAMGGGLMLLPVGTAHADGGLATGSATGRLTEVAQPVAESVLREAPKLLPEEVARVRSARSSES